MKYLNDGKNIFQETYWNHPFEETLKTTYRYICAVIWFQTLQCGCIFSQLPKELEGSKGTRKRVDRKALISLFATQYVEGGHDSRVMRKKTHKNTKAAAILFYFMAERMLQFTFSANFALFTVCIYVSLLCSLITFFLHFSRVSPLSFFMS